MNYQIVKIYPWCYQILLRERFIIVTFSNYNINCFLRNDRHQNMI